MSNFLYTHQMSDTTLTCVGLILKCKFLYSLTLCKLNNNMSRKF